MRIQNIKINGIKNPIGFEYDKMYVSYCIDEEPTDEIILTMFDENGKIVYAKTLDYSQNYYTPIDFIPQKEMRYSITISCGKEKATAYFETGTDFNCPFVTPEKQLSHPLIFRDFDISTVNKARLYITGLGLYEASLNGKKVGNEYLTPYCNDYRELLQYQTYDITDMIHAGVNRLEILLGNGWYKGRFGLKHKTNIYGKEYVCAYKVVIWDGQNRIEYKSDGTEGVRSSYILESSIYDGELRDDTSDISDICGVKIADVKYKVKERISLPVISKQLLAPKLIITPKGEKVLDFGQNFAGTVFFDNFLRKGERIRLCAGEILVDGCFFRENLRTAKAEFVYISDGVKKTVEPKFTFFGFRYMLVECDVEIKSSNFTGRVLYSDFDDTITVTSDNEKINRLLQNCIWGQRSNFIDVPTDCPQRDERLGYTGDAEIFCPTACYQADCRAFYKKYLNDIKIEQNKLKGGVPSYAPGFDEIEAASSVWADAITIIPWSVYCFYGDKSVLEGSFKQMQDYVDTVIAEDDKRGGKRLYNFGFHLGDWLSQDGVGRNALKAATNEYFIASCYYYNSVHITSLSAGVLGDNDKAEYYGNIAAQIKRAILDEYFTSSGRLAIDTQTAYAIAVMFDIYVDRFKLYDLFRKRMKKDCYIVKGGFVGATQLVQALFKSGLDEAAFRVLYNENFPGWLYCVNNGATTIWERWNAIDTNGGTNDSAMNSFNHYAFGAVAEGVYKYISGIIPTSIAFKSVRILPRFNYRLKKFNYRFLSPSGEFAENYSIMTDGSVKYTVNIPYGVSAEIEIDGKLISLKFGINEFDFAPNNRLVHPFSVDSTVCDIMNSAQATEVFKSIATGLYMFLSRNLMGMEGYTLRDLCALASFALPNSVFEKLDSDLRKITV